MWDQCWGFWGLVAQFAVANLVARQYVCVCVGGWMLRLWGFLMFLRSLVYTVQNRAQFRGQYRIQNSVQFRVQYRVQCIIYHVGTECSTEYSTAQYRVQYRESYRERFWALYSVAQSSVQSTMQSAQGTRQSTDTPQIPRMFSKFQTSQNYNLFFCKGA